MITHYFTLLALSRELRDLLTERPVTEVFTQQKNELWIGFGGDQTGNSDSNTLSLALSVNPGMNYCFLRPDATRARRNSTDLFPALAGARITGITVPSYDRALSFVFDNELTLRANLYNTSASNVLLLGSDGKVCEAFKHDKTLHETLITADRPRFDDLCLNDAGLFTRSIGSDPTLAITAAVKRTLPVLGALLTRELLHRAGVDPDRPADSLRPEELNSVFQALAGILQEASKPDPRIYFPVGGKAFFSLFRLSHVGDTRQEACASVNDGIRSAVFSAYRARSVDDEKKDLADRLNREADRIRRATALMATELADQPRGEVHEHAGKVLMANIHLLKRGLAEADLQDPFTPGAILHVSLDPALTPAQNAERYFDRARRARTSRLETERRRTTLLGKAGHLKRILDELEKSTTIDELKTFKKSHEKELKAMHVVTDDPKEESPPFRLFTVSGGFEVWVGKSSQNNDLLTTRYAKPNDLWFHVRGAGGSHTILRVPGGTEPTKGSILEAASIAAYYSKMRKAGTVPVAYCERKYVRKPKGAKEGSVTLEREKVVFVKPGLPKSVDEEEKY